MSRESTPPNGLRGWLLFFLAYQFVVCIFGALMIYAAITGAFGVARDTHLASMLLPPVVLCGITIVTALFRRKSFRSWAYMNLTYGLFFTLVLPAVGLDEWPSWQAQIFNLVSPLVTFIYLAKSRRVAATFEYKPSLLSA